MWTMVVGFVGALIVIVELRVGFVGALIVIVELRRWGVVVGIV